MENVHKSNEVLNRELELLKLDYATLSTSCDLLKTGVHKLEKQLQDNRSNLLKFNSFSVGLANLHYHEIFPFVVDNIKELFGVSAVWISKFDDDRMESMIEYSSLSDDVERRVDALLGQPLVGFKLLWVSDRYEKLISENFWDFASISDLTFGVIPTSLGGKIEEVIGVQWLSAIPLIFQGKLLGKLILLGTLDQVAPNREEMILFSGIVATELGRKRAEEALNKSEERFREMAELLPLSVWETNIDGYFSYVNSMGKTLFGYPKGIEISQTVHFLSVVAESDRSVMQYHMRRLFEGVPLNTVEYTAVRIDGSRFPAIASASVIYSNGKAVGVRGITFDITESKKKEEELVRARNQLQGVLDAATEVSIIVTDQFGNILVFNKGAEKMLGYSAEEVVGKQTPEFLHVKEELLALEHELSTELNVKVSGFEALVYKARAGHFENREWTYIRKDGAPVAVSLVITAMRDEKGGVVGFLGVAVDVTERKRVEKAIRESEEKYRTLMENMNEVVILVDNDDRILFVNKKFTAALGYSSEEIVGSLGYGLLLSDKDALTAKELSWQLRSSDTDQFEVSLLTKSGERVDFLASGSPLYNGNKNAVGYIGTLTDITDRKLAEKELREKTEEIEVQNEEYLQLNEELIQMNEELYLAKNRAEESDRLKSAFLANMSHEIRTPMNGIIGFSKILSEKDLSEEERMQYSSILNNSCMRLLNTVNDILDVSKIDSGLMELRYSNFLPSKILYELLSFYHDMFLKKGVLLELKVDARNIDIPINADVQKVYQILNNLLDNALKFTPEGGQVIYGFNFHDTDIEFYVKDTGIGISKEHQEFIFGRFNQENLTLSRGHEGTGLGLAICKGLVELMKGQIYVVSERGKGSKFTFTLPVISPVVLTTEPGSSFDSTNRGLYCKEKTVLVAEDDNTSYLLVERILTRELGAKVVRAKNGLEAVEIFRHNVDSISVILMDIKMPVMDGFEATRRIREVNQVVPIVALTAFAMKGDRENALAAGCNDYITKPVTPMQLLAKLQDYVAKK